MMIETNRLLLREMNPDDYQALFPVFNDPETIQSAEGGQANE